MQNHNQSGQFDHDTDTAASRLRTLRTPALVIVAVVAVVSASAAFIAMRSGNTMAATHEEKPKKAPKVRGVELVGPYTLAVPEDVRSALGSRKGGKDRIAVARAPTSTRPLSLFGSTALDPTRLVRVRARFAPAEVVKIGQTRMAPYETQSGRTEFRELRTGDRVDKGDVLGVFFSVDVGNKKRDLLDALVQLDLDQKILDKVEKNLAAVPEVYYLGLVRSVQGDRNAVNRALNNLKVWNIPQDEIDDLHEEAKKIAADKDAWYKTPEGKWVKGEKQKGVGKEIDAEDNNPWGKVTLRAPFAGIIVERNVTEHEIVQDPTTNLFQIAQVDRLLVIANAPEDELTTLNRLTFEQRKWTVRTVGPAATTAIEGRIDDIGYLIDPQQHTAIIKGYIANPKEAIRAGQFVTATIQIPPPENVVEVPVDAVVEDGKYAVVFVQTDAEKHHYQMRRVQVTHRFEHTVFVQSKEIAGPDQLTKEEKELGYLPKEPLRPGDRILTSGVNELKAALADLESSPLATK
jgi:cobalt-zinc-cadmium efflux system membrane fusion protein